MKRVYAPADFLCELGTKWLTGLKRVRHHDKPVLQELCWTDTRLAHMDENRLTSHIVTSVQTSRNLLVALAN